jgi:hypothetical protein
VPRREPRFDEELASFAHEHASADEPGDAASIS